MKKFTKSCLAFLISLCLVLGMVSTIPATADAESPQYMIHYKYLKRNGGMFGQNVFLENGKTYTLSFEYSMVAGSYNEHAILKVLDADIKDASKYMTSGYAFSSAEDEGSDKGFATKEEGTSTKGTATYTFTWSGSNSTNSVLFHTPGGSTTDIEFYIANVVLYESNDTAKTNLMESVDTNGNLNGWRHPQYLAGEQTEFLPLNEGMAYYRANLETYDESLFQMDKYMVYYEYGKQNGGMFGQNVTLESGKTYTISYQYSMVEGAYNEDAILKILNADISGAASLVGSGYAFSSAESSGSKAFTKVEEGTSTKGTATYTFTWSGGTAASVLFHTAGGTSKDIKFYFADMKLYANDDAKKTNLLQSVDTNGSLKGWRHPSYLAGDADTTWYAGTESKKLYTLTMMDYDVSYFEQSEEKSMYHFTYLQADGGMFGQTVSFEKGQEYTISFEYHMLKQVLNSDQGLMLKVSPMAFTSTSVASNVTFSSANEVGSTNGFATEDMQGTTSAGKVTYTFTWTGNSGDGSVWFHASGGRSREIEFYFANMTLYKSNDANKVNLLPSGQSEGTLDGWKHPGGSAPASGSTSWTAQHGGTNRYTVTVEKYDASKFVAEGKMIHLVSAVKPVTAIFGKIVTLEANTSYTISYRYKFVQGGLNETVYLKVRNPYRATTQKTYFESKGTENPFATVSFDEQNGIATYTFTNVTAGDYGIGFEFSGVTDMYLADFSIYKTAEETNTTVLSSSFDNSGWTGWYKDATGNPWTCTQNSVDLYTATIVDYNGTLFIDNCGDVNGDRVITAKDLVKLHNAIQEGQYIESADLTQDGKTLDESDYNALVDVILAGKALKVAPVALFEEQSGGADDAAATMKATINSVTDTVKNATTTGSTYYVANSGNDSNAGTSWQKPFKTISKINDLIEAGTIKSGDKVLFQRGSVFRTEEALQLIGGVSYGAYDNKSWAKPVILGSYQNFADAKWTETSTPNVWKLAFDYTDADPGVMTFNNDSMVGVRKENLSELCKNGDYYRAKDANASDKSLYLYMSYGNPADCFDNIEIGALKRGMDASTEQDNITIENIDIKYVSHLAMSFMFDDNITIKGCSIGWIGGGFKDDTGVRYGNAIQFWASAQNCSVTNCHIYQVFDAAYTFQGCTYNEKGEFNKMTFDNNLVEYTSMNVEFWADSGYATTKQGNGIMTNITISNNILRFAGYGWGSSQRDVKASQAFILGWERTYNNGTVSNFKISNNTFDCANCYFERTGADYITYSGNKYYQKENYGTYYTTTKYYADSSAGTIPTDQSTLEAGIAEFDKNAASVQWISE